MKPDKKILYKGKHGKPEEAFLTEKSLIKNSSQLLSQQTATNKALTHAMKSTKLEDHVDDPETFEQMLADDFSSVIEQEFDERGYSKDLQESLMFILNPLFNNWFNKNFRGTNSSSAIILPDTDYKVHFYKHFKKEFAELFSMLLGVFPPHPGGKSSLRGLGKSSAECSS